MTASSTYALQGSLTTPSCGGGYGAENATVEVRDQSNNLVAGTTTSSDDKSVTGKCHVVFAAVALKPKFYQFKVGTHGAPDYTFAQMQGNNWHIDLTMGA